MLRSLEERQSLYDAHHDMVRSAVWRVSAPKPPTEDLLVVGEMALWVATEGYDAARGAKFSTYAWRTITGMAQKELRDRSRMVRIPAAKAATDPERYEVSVVSLDDGYVEFPYETDFTIELTYDMLFSAIPEAQHDGLRYALRHYVEGYTIQELAEAAGKQPASVKRLMVQALDSLKRNPTIQDWAGIYPPPLPEKGNGEKAIRVAGLEVEHPHLTEEGRGLTQGAREILWLRYAGNTLAAVAYVTGLRAKTVQWHITRAYRALGVDNLDAALEKVFEGTRVTK